MPRKGKLSVVLLANQVKKRKASARHQRRSQQAELQKLKKRHPAEYAEAMRRLWLHPETKGRLEDS